MATQTVARPFARSRFRSRTSSTSNNPLFHSGRAHLVGIGGSGMQSLAAVLAASGWRVSGSDQAAGCSPVSAGAFPRSIRRYIGHAPSQVPASADVVVYSSAIPESNCERQAARAHGIPELSYAQMLGRLLAGRIGVAVAGTHGKSTTAAMLTSILVEAGADPTSIIGAVPIDADCGGRRGAGDHIIVEACEYERNFLELEPRAAAVLNLEWDHCDTYCDLIAVERAFRQFVGRLPDDGVLVVNRDCTRAVEDVCPRGGPIVTFGISGSATWLGGGLQPVRGRYAFQIWRRARRVTEVSLAVPGLHNLYNALAAAALAGELGASAVAIRCGLELFLGLRRRCETLGTYAGVTLVDDYAHHPSEVRATLATLRQKYPGRRLWCVFQPHQARRTAALLDEFANSLHNADAVLVADIYRAREGDSPAVVTSEDLAARISSGPKICEALASREAIVDRLVCDCVPGDVVVACGAGDIGKVLHELRERL